MYLDRSVIKERSRQIIRDSNPRVLTASLIVVALSVVIGMLSGRLVGISNGDLLRYLQYVQEGNADAALRFLAAHSPSAGARLVDLMLTCVNAIVGLGFLIFLLNSLRATAPDMGNLLDGFNYWWKLLVMNFVCGIFTVLWSLLLVVPGIIAAYRYSMANYILINRPELGIMECIRESKRLTDGHKGELFMLDLSFLGWWLLCLIPVLGWILLVWVSPYRMLCVLQYYEQYSGFAAPAEAPRSVW